MDGSNPRQHVTTRRTARLVTEENWKFILSLSLSKAQKWYLRALRNRDNYGLVPNIYPGKKAPIVNYNAILDINKKLRSIRSSLRLLQIGRSGSYGNMPFKLYHVE